MLQVINVLNACEMDYCSLVSKVVTQHVTHYQLWYMFDTPGFKQQRVLLSKLTSLPADTLTQLQHTAVSTAWIVTLTLVMLLLVLVLLCCMLLLHAGLSTQCNRRLLAG
jgi:hypothetical protein